MQEIIIIIIIIIIVTANCHSKYATTQLNKVEPKAYYHSMHTI